MRHGKPESRKIHGLEWAVAGGYLPGNVESVCGVGQPRETRIGATGCELDAVITSSVRSSDLPAALGGQRLLEGYGEFFAGRKRVSRLKLQTFAIIDQGHGKWLGLVVTLQGDLVLQGCFIIDNRMREAQHDVGFRADISLPIHREGIDHRAGSGFSSMDCLSPPPQAASKMAGISARVLLYFMASLLRTSG